MSMSNSSVRAAEASIPAVRVPGLGKAMITSKYTPPSGVM